MIQGLSLYVLDLEALRRSYNRGHHWLPSVTGLEVLGRNCGTNRDWLLHAKGMKPLGRTSGQGSILGRARSRGMVEGDKLISQVNEECHNWHPPCWARQVEGEHNKRSKEIMAPTRASIPRESSH